MANTKITSGVIADDAITAALIADNAVGISALNVSDGSDGQVLTTNGAGTLSFSTISAGVAGISTSADATAITITSGENVLIGGTTDRSRKLVVEGTGDLMTLYSTNAGSGGAQLDLIHDSASYADNDSVGIVNFSTDNRQLASIKGVGQSSGDKGVFHIGVRKDSSNYTHDALRIENAGDELYCDIYSPSGSNRGAGYFRFKTDGSSTDQSVAQIYMEQGSGDGGSRKCNMYLQVSDNGAPTTAVTIENNKNVTFAGGINVGGAGQFNSNTIYAANMYVADDIGHKDDADTYMSFENDYLGFYTGGNSTMVMSNGLVTKPTQPAFDVAKNNGYQADDNNFIQDQVRTNVGSHYSTSTGRFTAPVAGQYLISFRIFTHDSGGVVQAEVTLKKNGADHHIFRAHKVGGYHTPVQGTKVITLAANDYIQTYVGDSGTSSGWMGSAGEYNYFSGFLIS